MLLLETNQLQALTTPPCYLFTCNTTSCHTILYMTLIPPVCVSVPACADITQGQGTY